MEQNNKKSESVINDLKNAFKQDMGTSFTAVSRPPNRSDASGIISTKTALKILLPLVVLFVVGFLIYTFFFYTV